MKIFHKILISIIVSVLIPAAILAICILYFQRSHIDSNVIKQSKLLLAGKMQTSNNIRTFSFAYDKKSGLVTEGDLKQGVDVFKSKIITDPTEKISFRRLEILYQGICTIGTTVRCGLISVSDVKGSVNNFLNMIMIFGIILCLFVFIISYFVSRSIVRPIEILSKYVSKKEEGDYSFTLDGTSDDEIHLLSNRLKEYVDKLKDYQKKETETARSNAIYELSRQVAHDIRSPIIALDAMTEKTPNFPEEDRSIIRNSITRIKDISNKLLFDHSKTETINLKKVMLSTIIPQIVSEKRIQYHERKEVSIEAFVARDCYGVFVNVDTVELKRVLSNIMNNSVEAITDNGSVTIRTKLSGDNFVNLIVEDTGLGIPEEIIGSIFEKGVTTKNAGAGLGLFHAKEKVNEWGGKLTVESKLEEGTKIIITLPTVEPENWYLEKINLTNIKRVIILDDETGIHRIWKDRITSISKEIELVDYYNPKEFLTECKANDDSFSTLYLIDYEFIGSHHNGIEIIDKLQIYRNSILVTSRFEDYEIEENCNKKKIKMLPKDMARLIPLMQSTTPKISSQQKAILLDDDFIVCSYWAQTAKLREINLDIFNNYRELLKVISDYTDDVEIYVDSDLKDDMNGEDVARLIYNKGYKNIWLETGQYQENLTKHLPWLKGIIDKRCPWR